MKKLALDFLSFLLLLLHEIPSCLETEWTSLCRHAVL
jgi:hypothetical protein